MVDVCVAQDDGGQARWRKGKVAIAFVRVRAPAQDQSTIEKQAQVTRFHQMHRTCHSLGGTPKRHSGATPIAMHSLIHFFNLRCEDALAFLPECPRCYQWELSFAE